jgi:hypothetical protein
MFYLKFLEQGKAPFGPSQIWVSLKIFNKSEAVLFISGQAH